MAIPIDKKETLERMRALPQVRRWREGNYEPGGWFTAKPTEEGGIWGSWGHRFQPNRRRGVSMVELNRADRHPIPAEGLGLISDREAGTEPDTPRYDYPLNQKYQVWSYNVESLYEEAVSRQWSATRDIPWDKLEPLSDDQERALCQFVGFLHTVEFIPGDTLPFYMARVDPSFAEVRLFMSSQCADEARHMEVFGKRMYANGGGPGMEPGAEALFQFDPRKSVLPEEAARVIASVNPTLDFLAYSYFVQMIGEGVVLDFFRFGEFLGRNPCDKEMFRRIMQDEARHVSFGTMRIKYYLENAPRQEREAASEMLHYLASVTETSGAGFGLLVHPSAVEPFALLAAGSTGNLDKGWDVVREFWAAVVEEYLDRCDRAGLPRRGRCMIPDEAPF